MQDSLSLSHSADASMPLCTKCPESPNSCNVPAMLISVVHLRLPAMNSYPMHKLQLDIRNTSLIACKKESINILAALEALVTSSYRTTNLGLTPKLLPCNAYLGESGEVRDNVLNLGCAPHGDEQLLGIQVHRHIVGRTVLRPC